MAIKVSDEFLKYKIKSIYSKQFGIDVEAFSNEAIKIYQLYDMKKKLDRDIVDYYEDIIVIPEGSEDTLILDLKKFNLSYYGTEYENDDEEIDAKIFVKDEYEKEELLKEVEENIVKGKYDQLKINTPLTMTATKFNKKLKSMRSRFRETYGSKIFKDISDMIEQHNILYNQKIEDDTSKKKNKRLKNKKILGE